MTKETETQIASDEDLTRLFAGKPTQYRKSKSLPKFTGEAMRTCATINRIFFDVLTRPTACSTSSFPTRGRAYNSRRRSMWIMASA